MLSFRVSRFYFIILILVSHYNDVIMCAMASHITSITIVYSSVYSGADQRKHQGSASLGFVRGIHRWPVNSPHKRPVTQKMLPFDDVIMFSAIIHQHHKEKTIWPVFFLPTCAACPVQFLWVPNLPKHITGWNVTLKLANPGNIINLPSLP